MGTTTTDMEAPAAQQRLAEAKSEVQSLMGRLDAGDAEVTGAMLVAAETEVRAAETFLAGASRRDRSRQEAARQAAAEQAVKDLVDQHEQTIVDVRSAFADAVAALERLADAAGTHHGRTGANVQAAADLAGESGPASPLLRWHVLGHRRLQPTEPAEVLRAAHLVVATGRGIVARHELYGLEALVEALRSGDSDR